VLLGVLSGQILKTSDSTGKKFLMLTGAGVGCLALGWLWGLWFPIIKHIWTSSMVLWATGWSYLLLALFYGVIDGLGLRKWAFPFVVIGMNAIFAYMVTHVVDFGHIAGGLAGGLAKHFGEHGDAVVHVTAFLIVWFILFFLYRKRTFIKV
jgi:predicted acyltransferase